MQFNWQEIQKFNLDQFPYLDEDQSIEYLTYFLQQILYGKNIPQEEYYKIQIQNLKPLLQALQMGILYMEYCSYSHKEIEQKIDIDLALIKKQQKRLEKNLLSNKDELKILKDDIKTEKLTIKALKDKLDNSHFWKCYFCQDAIYQEQKHLDEHMLRRHEDKIKEAEKEEQRKNDPSEFLLQQNILLGQQMILLTGHQNKNRDNYIQSLALKEDLSNAKNLLKLAKAQEKQLNNQIKQNFINEQLKQKEINEMNEKQTNQQLLKQQFKSEREIRDLKQYVQALEQRLNEVNQLEQQTKANFLIQESKLKEVLKQQEVEQKQKTDQSDKHFDEHEEQYEKQQLQERILIEQNEKKQRRMLEEIENFYDLSLKICQTRLNGQRIQFTNEEKEKVIEKINSEFKDLQNMSIYQLEEHLDKIINENQNINILQFNNPSYKSTRKSLKSFVTQRDPQYMKKQINDYNSDLSSSQYSDQDLLIKSLKNQSQQEIRKNSPGIQNQSQEEISKNSPGMKEEQFNKGSPISIPYHENDEKSEIITIAKKGQMMSLNVNINEYDEKKEKFQFVKGYVNKYVVNQ